MLTNAKYCIALSAMLLISMAGYAIPPAPGINRIERAPQQTMLSSFVPATGIVRIPVILVNFTDVAFTIDDPVTKFNDFYNGNGGTNPCATGSVHDYYIASSLSSLDLQYDVYGPFTLSHNREYYGGNSGQSSNKNAKALVQEAAQLAYEAGVNLSVYDNNGDGFIDNLSIVTAGHNEAEGGPEESIWPHYSTINSSTTYNNVVVRGYLVISEFRGYIGATQAGIGTYCHEFGHALGLPDMYNTTRSGAYTVGTWDIMCQGSYNNYGCTPPTFTAFERFMLGWLTPEQLVSTGNKVLEPIETSNKAYLIAQSTHNLQNTQPSPSEYFLLENRQRIGWDGLNDEALTGTGMMISHITWNGAKWSYNTFNNDSPLGFDIVEAVAQNPTQSSPSDLFPGSGMITSWIPKLNAGTELNEQKLSNIFQYDDGTISFRFGQVTDQGFLFTPEMVPQLTTTFNINRITADTVQITIRGLRIPSDTVEIYLSHADYAFSPDSGVTWFTNGQHYLDSSVNADSTYSCSLLVYFRAKRQECTPVRCNLIVTTTDGKEMNQLMLTAISPRPTYITAPDSLTVHSLGSTSFTAQWNTIEDAQYYYVTLYSRKDSTSTFVQSFEDFHSQTAITRQDWQSNFARTYSSDFKDGAYSLLMQESGEYVISESYPEPVLAMSFWLSNNYTTMAGETPEGVLVVEGRRENGVWQQIDKIITRRTTKSLPLEYTFTANDSIVQFRLSYQHKAGNGGILIDAFSATMAHKITYIYRGVDYETDINKAIFGALEPSTDYFWKVRAYENKGCNAHYSPWSALNHVTTLTPKENSTLTIRRSSQGEYFVDLNEPANGNAYLCIYADDGSIISKHLIPYGTTSVALPQQNLVYGHLYIVKLVYDQLKRKTDYGKILYY